MIRPMSTNPLSESTLIKSSVAFFDDVGWPSPLDGRLVLGAGVDLMFEAGGNPIVLLDFVGAGDFEVDDGARSAEVLSIDFFGEFWDFEAVPTTFRAFFTAELTWLFLAAG